MSRSPKNPAVPAIKRLLTWYDGNGRMLPWRKRGGPGDPYRVWLSEIMLQQTTAAAVAPYYEKFIERWPDVSALAAAPLDDVLAAWSGLGYYARARNLHKAAGIVAGDMNGVFPATAESLRALPGIGPYTAGAIAAISFGAREAAMDANAERVVARLFAVEEPLPAARKRLAGLCRDLVPADRPGDFAQAMMDLGALVCSPTSPSCTECPLTDFCDARTRGIAERLPVRAKKPARPVRRVAAFVARDGQGRVLLVRRPEHGLLARMWQPPLSDFAGDFPGENAVAAAAPFPARWHRTPGVVRHVFTHFALEAEVYTAEVTGGRDVAGGSWVAPAEFSGFALPTVMRKILAHAGIPR